MYEVTVTRVFCAAHAVRLPGGEVEPVHGHNWEVRVTVAAEELDELDWVMDFHELERAVDAVVNTVHNRDLNEVGPFAEGRGRMSPTAERVAWWVGTEVARGLPGHVRLAWVTVTEAPGCMATYRP